MTEVGERECKTYTVPLEAWVLSESQRLKTRSEQRAPTGVDLNTTSVKIGGSKGGKGISQNTLSWYYHDRIQTRELENRSKTASTRRKRTRRLCPSDSQQSYGHWDPCLFCFPTSSLFSLSFSLLQSSLTFIQSTSNMNSLALLPRPLDDQNKPIVGTFVLLCSFFATSDLLSSSQKTTARENQFDSKPTLFKFVSSLLRITDTFFPIPGERCR